MESDVITPSTISQNTCWAKLNKKVATFIKVLITFQHLLKVQVFQSIRIYLASCMDAK